MLHHTKKNGHVERTISWKVISSTCLWSWNILISTTPNACLYEENGIILKSLRITLNNELQQHIFTYGQYIKTQFYPLQLLHLQQEMVLIAVDLVAQ